MLVLVIVRIPVMPARLPVASPNCRPFSAVALPFVVRLDPVSVKFCTPCPRIPSSPLFSRLRLDRLTSVVEVKRIPTPVVR